jgi:hypothetical protein
LSQDRSGDAALPVPADEVDLANACAQSLKEGSGGGVGELHPRAAALSNCDKDHEKRSIRTLGAASVDGQEMPEGDFVVRLTGLSSAKS